MSLRATLWAYDDAPVDNGTQVLCLIALADEANDAGRNAFPSIRKVAARARVKRRAAQYALRKLEEQGVIVHGDQSIAAQHIKRKDRRPTVYDLCMSVTWESVGRTRPGDDEDAADDGAQDMHPATERGAEPQTDEVQPHVERGAEPRPTGVHPGAPDPTTDPTMDPPFNPRADDSLRSSSDEQGMLPVDVQQVHPVEPVLKFDRARQLPDDFMVTKRMREWFMEKHFEGVDGPAETEHFRDHHLARGTTMKDWEKAWQVWIRRSAQYAARRNGFAPKPPANRHHSPNEAGNQARIAALGG